MRRILAATGLAAGLGLSFVPAAQADPLPCETYSPPKVCVPSWCFTAQLVVGIVNDAAGDPLGRPFPTCID